MEITKMPNLRKGSKGGFEPGLSRLRVRRSTIELPRVCTYVHANVGLCADECVHECARVGCSFACMCVH